MKYVCNTKACMQVNELVDMRGSYVDWILNTEHVMNLLNVHVQGNVFTTEHARCIYFIFFILV